MAKKGVKIYMSENDLTWLEKFPPCETQGASATLAAEWGIAQIRRGAKTAFLALDLDERRAIIASLNGTLWDFVKQGPESLVWHLEDWFALDAGMVWEWPENKVKSLLDKVKAFSPAEVAGIICWSQGFWENREGKNLDEYADNISQLL